MNDFFSSIKRTPYQSLASLLTLFFTLFLSLFFFMLTSFFHSLLDYVETRPQVTVYFNTKTSETEIFKLQKVVADSGKASSIKYISQKDAYQIYRRLNRDNPLLLEMVSPDILPASLEIYAAKPAYLAEIASFVNKQPGVDEVSFQKDIVDKLLVLTTVLRRTSIALLLFLLITSIIVLITTTAFKIALKKDEIELMQLLGATSFYIQKPFLLEGMFFGFISASAAFGLLLAVILSLKSFLSGYMSSLSALPFFGLSQFHLYVWPPSPEFLLLTYGLVVLFGISIGFFGTLFASAKYIK